MESVQTLQFNIQELACLSRAIQYGKQAVSGLEVHHGLAAEYQAILTEIEERVAKATNNILMDDIASLVDTRRGIKPTKPKKEKKANKPID